MLRQVLRSALIVGVCSTLFSATQMANAALLLNYQFDQVEATTGVETNTKTPDSAGTYTSAGATPFTNALIGYSTNLPTLTPGPVGNSLYQSLNPNNSFSFISAVSSSGTQNNYTRVQTNDASAGVLDASFTNFSVAMWVNPTSTTNTRYMAGKMGGTGQRGWSVASDAGLSNLVIDYFDVAAGTNTRTLKIADGILPLNQWTHIAFTFSATVGLTPGTENIYINGVNTPFTVEPGSAASIPTSLNSSNSADFKVGHRGATGASIQGWIGGLDDIRIYNSTLDQAGVSALLVPVPEPSTYALAAVGLVGLGLLRRRK